MKVGFEEMISAADAAVTTRSLDEATQLCGSDSVVFVDIRDVRELWRDGKIAGAMHVPRGMLEFWAHPESPYHKPVFAEDKQFVLYCASGWRSALATKALQDMGMKNVSHLEGGFSAWRDAGKPVVEVDRK